jgi:hypothetical protein
MSTRSLIGIEQRDERVEYIWCHFDGHPEHHGIILGEHYATEVKVRELIALGDLECLRIEIGSTVEPGERGQDNPDHVDKHPDWCLALMRDFGRSTTSAAPRMISGRVAWTNMSKWPEWLYLFTKDGEWLVYGYEKGFRRWTPLSDVMQRVQCE